MDDYESQPDELLDTLKGWFREDFDAATEWRKEAKTDYAFAAPGGEKQWDESDRNTLRDQGRPCVSFNRILPVISSVMGQEIGQRAEITYKPRTTQTAMGQPGMPPIPGADDQGPAETLSAAAQYLRDQCDAEDEESDAFQDTVTCGMGWVETRVDYEENPDGDLREDRIDPMEMLWDCKAQKRNLIDTRRVWRVREIDKDQAKAEFDTEDLTKLDAAWARIEETDQPHDREAARYYAAGNEFDHTRKTVTLVECQWFEYKTTYNSVDPMTGQSVELESKKQADNYAKNVLTMTGQQVPVSTAKKRVYYTALIGGEILHKEESQSQECFKYQAMTGYRDRNSKQWVGLVRSMRDPQRWANALYSSVLHQVQTTGKGIMAERGAFEDDKKAEKDWANGSRIVFLTTGAIAGNKIKQKDQHQLPQGVFELMNFALGAFRDVTGVNIEAMGLADRQQAASLEYQRRQAANQILAPLFDGLRRFRKDNGRLLLDLIQNYLSDGRLVRVVGPDYERYVPLIKQDETIEYDIIVDESPSSPNQKEASWAVLQQLLPVIAGEGTPPQVIGKLLKASPLPESVVNDFVESAETAAQNAGPSPEQMQLQITAEKGKADIALKQMDLQLKATELEQEKIKMGADLQIKQMDMMGKQQQYQFDADALNMDMKSKQMEIEASESAEAMKMFGKDFPNQIQQVLQNQQGIAQALVAGQQQLAEALQMMAAAQQQTAAALLVPKVTVLSPDGTSATTQPMTMQ